MPRRIPAQIEPLEGRLMLSAVPALGYTPGQIRHAYGIDQVFFSGPHGSRIVANGRGQTIAIVDSYDDPNVAADLLKFDQLYDLPTNDETGKPILTKVKLPGVTFSAAWCPEIAMDVEWAHAIAPEAHILLVEARSAASADIVKAVNYARIQPGVSVVSMSFDGSEFQNETSDDATFTTPPHHLGGGGRLGGVTFVAAAGDSGSPAGWPAVSPNVIAVGGTTLRLSNSNNRISETGWSSGGGGTAFFEAEPSYQQRLAPDYGYRVAPDVAYDADPMTGFSVFDSIPYHGRVGWQRMAGTSGGVPQWAALIALADEGRSLIGKGSLDGPHETLPDLYRLPSADFHDITVGDNGSLAGPGYDQVTGRGTPVANLLVAGLVRS